MYSSIFGWMGYVEKNEPTHEPITSISPFISPSFQLLPSWQATTFPVQLPQILGAHQAHIGFDEVFGQLPAAVSSRCWSFQRHAF